MSQIKLLKCGQYVIISGIGDHLAVFITIKIKVPRIKLEPSMIRSETVRDFTRASSNYTSARSLLN